MKKIVMSALTLAIAACMSATPVISASASDDDFVCGTSLAEQELREREFEDISIKAPTKYFYQYGDKLDLSGGAIYADNMLVCYMDSPENCFLPDAQVEIDTHQFVNSDFGVYPVNVRVKINGKEFRQIFCVAVEEPENAAIELADVTIADEAEEVQATDFETLKIKVPDKKYYQYGEKLDLTGGEIYAGDKFICSMTDPTANVEIDTHQFVNSDFGAYPINIKATVDGKNYYGIFCVAVEEPENAAIELADVTIADEAEEVQATDFETLKIKVPDKKYYQYGEKLDLTGGEIYAGDKFICSMTDPTANVEIDTHQFVNSDFGAYPINIKATVDGKNYYGIFCVAVEEPETAVELDDVKIANDDIAYGDVNLDGRVSISDSVAVLQFIANPEKYALTDEQKANADVHNTGDGVTLKDAEAIGAFAEGMIDLF